jgi:hypothetical protein
MGTSGEPGGYHNAQPQEEWMTQQGRSEVSAQIREINDMLSLSTCMGDTQIFFRNVTTSNH